MASGERENIFINTENQGEYSKMARTVQIFGELVNNPPFYFQQKLRPKLSAELINL